MRLVSLLACLGLLHIAAGLFSGSDGVLVLTDKDFDSRLRKDSSMHLVMVYSPQCGHCHAMQAAYVQAAKALKGIVTVAAVDGTTNAQVANKLQVSGFPALKLFGDNRQSPIAYEGQRDAKSMVEWVLNKVQTMTRERMGIKTSSSSSKGSSGDSSEGKFGGKHVTTLTEDNFDSIVGKDEAVFVAFYAPWCGHCKSLAPDFERAAAELEGELRFAAVDATVHSQLAQRFGVRGYPTIKFFAPGKGKGKDYQGPRSASEMAAAARELVEAGGGLAGSVVDLTSAKQWEEECGSKRLCILSFLPHILDDGAVRRNKRLEQLRTAAGKVGKRNLFRFLWAELGSQPGLEASLNVGMVPAAYAVAADKKVFTPHKGSFEASQLAAFVSGLTIKVEGAQPFKPASITSVPAWDGKDVEVPVEEKYSLADLEL